MNKDFKKIFAVMMVIAMLVTQLAMPAVAATTYYCQGCGDTGVLGDLLYTIDATCKDGYAIYECDANIGTAAKPVDCTGTITIVIPGDPAVHVSDETTVEAVAPTCTEDGTVAYETCTVCGCYLIPGTTTKLNTIVDPKTGHSYDAVVTDPKCTEGGFTTYTCSVCGDTYDDDATDALDHDFSVFHAAQAATCKEEGWSVYYTCSRCGAEDPERSKVVEPIQDHGLSLVDHRDATCTVAGFNTFKCNEPTCPYFNGITENLKALGHSLTTVAAVKVTCEEDGHKEYKYCTREGCGYTTDTAAHVIPALGHHTVSAGYIAPTCTTEGCTDAIICDRCNLIHHAGEVIAPTGHDLKTIIAKDATCTSSGNIAYTQCKTCNVKFAANTVNDATNFDAEPLTETTVISKLGHDYETIVIDPTCTDNGYTVYTCKRDNCTHTYSEIIAATGHAFEAVAQVDPTCLNTGVAAHNKCTTCNELFAADADASDITIEPVDQVDLTIDALGHTGKIVDHVNPTYDAAGNEAGEQCARCGEPLQNAAILNELDEAVAFRYEIVGVNNAATAVNSGYVTLNVYFDVLADADDKEEYNSDVLANIFGVDLSLAYDNTSFELTHVEVAPGVFAKAEFTPYKQANDNGVVAISQDIVTGSKAFRGENLFATLTFQVKGTTATGTYNFTNTNLNVVHPEGETIDTTTSMDGTSIEVKKLGDANADTIFTTHDTLEVSKYIEGADLSTEYVAIYDMDKDGDIDFADLDLIRKANVGNEEYLGIIVDPNA